MADDTLILTFPKTSVLWDNGHYIQIDTKLTRSEFILAVMRSETEPTAVIKRD